MAEDVGVATVDGAMHQHGGTGGGMPPHHQHGTGTTIHSSDTLALDAPSPAPPEGMTGKQHHQFRQSGSHLSGMSDKQEPKTDAAKEKELESYEDRLERSVSGLSGRVTSMPEGHTIPHDPQCGCIAPIPPFPTTAK